MISIDFTPRAEDISWDSLEGSGKTLQELTADDFTFRYFMADATIHDHEKGRILLVTPGLPVIDFVMMLVQMKRETLTMGRSTVETSQTQDSIHAVRQDDTVRLDYSFSEIVSHVPLGFFKEIPGVALRAALQVMYSRHGDLRFNHYLNSLSGVV
ncbi:hypothetical protein ACIQ6K_27755 [Streptomyces sp. NPDC096354]|uniref:hypothetical protein n=1 Tax=Streptomyces sp. NPDC096354 TaxID=3366088 RepID=UPI00381A431D